MTELVVLFRAEADILGNHPRPREHEVAGVSQLLSNGRVLSIFCA